jgi:uncharacterized protein (DUF58 family)
MMREGDDPRDIYWKRSTTSDARLVMERSSQVLDKAHLTIDNLMTGAEPSKEEARLFEKYVRETASLAVAHLRRGEQVFLRTTSGGRVAASPASGSDATLRFLALLEMEHEGVRGVPSVHLAGGRGGALARGPKSPPPSVTVAPIHLSRPARPDQLAPVPPEASAGEKGADS